MYADLNLEVRDVVQPDGSTSTHAVVLRDDVVVILPLRWSDANELEVLLDEQPHDAVNDPYIAEAPNRRMEPHERDPYLVAGRIRGEESQGDTTAGKHLLMSDVMAAPAFTSERWHLLAGYDIQGAEWKIAGRWRTLRKAMAELDNVHPHRHALLPASGERRSTAGVSGQAGRQPRTTRLSTSTSESLSSASRTGTSVMRSVQPASTTR
jgi:hypothetical protein